LRLWEVRSFFWGVGSACHVGEEEEEEELDLGFGCTHEEGNC